MAFLAACSQPIISRVDWLSISTQRGPSNVADQAFSDTARSLNRLVPFVSYADNLLPIIVRNSRILSRRVRFLAFRYGNSRHSLRFLFFTHLYTMLNRSWSLINNRPCKWENFTYLIFLVIIPQERINKFILRIKKYQFSCQYPRVSEIVIFTVHFNSKIVILLL